MLAVAVELNEGVCAKLPDSVRDARAIGRRDAALARLDKQMDVRMARGELAHGVGRTVGRVTVDDDHGPPELGHRTEYLAELGEYLRYGPCLVVGGYDDSDMH